MVIRWIAAAIVFVAAAVGGIVVAGGSLAEYEAALDAFALITIAAVLLAGLAYALVEYAQTGGVASISRQFDTRTIVLIPIGIAVNVLLGQAVAAALKLPIYLDSIGTILVGALAGPVPGILTGLSANLLWTYVLPAPFHSDFAAPFAIVAAAIGLLAGIAGRAGFLRPRPNRSIGELVVAGAVALLVVGGLAWYTYTRFYKETFTFFNPDPATDPGLLLMVLSWAVAIVVVGAVVGFLALLFVRRDAAVAWVVVAGAVTGLVAGLASAPIAANLFGGVTGAGTDLLVLFFRQQGADVLSASFQQSLISDPIDKVTTFLVVYLILSALARRTKARFPQGERLLDSAPDPNDMQGAPA
jgi:energy-coupling factor transport system substrate-specific component